MERKLYYFQMQRAKQFLFTSFASQNIFHKQINAFSRFQLKINDKNVLLVKIKYFVFSLKS